MNSSMKNLEKILSGMVLLPEENPNFLFPSLILAQAVMFQAKAFTANCLKNSFK